MKLKLFHFHNYTYKPNLKRKRKTKLKVLTEKYEPLFLKLINKEKLSYEDELIYLNAFNDVKKYLVSGLLINIQKDYSSKSKQEQKLETLFNQYKYFFEDSSEFLFRIKIDIEDLCDDIIYSSLGFGKKKFVKTNENSNFISYLNSQLFFATLNLLDKKVNSIKVSKEIIKNKNYDEKDISEELSKEEEIDILLKEKNIESSVDKKTFIEIRNILINEDTVPDNLVDIINFILEK